jgi:hypothetical protein
MGDLIERLTREKGLLEGSLKTLQEEIEVFKSKTSDFDVTVNENSPAEMRRLEGFYRQLREQFEEKSQLLDSTRKELFHTKEKLSAAEKENLEKEITSPQISIEEHTRHLAQMEEELKNELELSHQEIKRLYALINSSTNPL